MNANKRLIQIVILPEAPGRGQGGDGRPSNVLQDHFSNSSNFGVKISGGGG